MTNRVLRVLPGALILIFTAGTACENPSGPARATSATSKTATPTPKPTAKPGAPSPTPVPGAPSSGSSPNGAITGFNYNTGVVFGSAYDGSTPVVQVEFYFDGAMGAVSLGGTASTGGGNFNFSVPAAVKDGKIHRVWAYLVSSAGFKVLLQSAPYSFFVGSTAAGLNYFNANVKPAMTGAVCFTCHNFDFYGNNTASMADYISMKTHLAHPSNLEGGTRTDNEMFNRPVKADGANPHPGTKCTANSSPCVFFPGWWDAEFN